jgi:hypothetical protein
MTVTADFFKLLRNAVHQGRLPVGPQGGTPRKTRAFRARGEPPNSRTSIRMLVKACNRGYEPPEPSVECLRRYGLK